MDRDIGVDGFTIEMGKACFWWPGGAVILAEAVEGSITHTGSDRTAVPDAEIDWSER